MSALPQMDERACRRIVSTAALLTSPQDGERLAASHGLERLLAPHGLSLADLIKRALLSEEPRRPGPVECNFLCTTGWLDVPLDAADASTIGSGAFSTASSPKSACLPSRRRLWTASFRRSTSRLEGAMLATDRLHIDVAAIRATYPIPSIAGSTLKLIRAGHEWKACCPFHQDSPLHSPSSRGRTLPLLWLWRDRRCARLRATDASRHPAGGCGHPRGRSTPQRAC